MLQLGCELVWAGLDWYLLWCADKAGGKCQRPMENWADPG